VKVKNKSLSKKELLAERVKLAAYGSKYEKGILAIDSMLKDIQISEDRAIKRKEKLTALVNGLVLEENPKYTELLLKIEHLLDTTVIKEFEFQSNGNLLVQDTSEEMKTLISTALTVNRDLEYRAEDIVFHRSKAVNGDGAREIFEATTSRIREDKHKYSSSAGTIGSFSTTEALLEMREIYAKLAKEHEEMKSAMSTYLGCLLEAIKKQDIKAIEVSTREVAEKFSNLPHEEIISKSKQLAKQMFSAEKQKEDIFFVIKDNCKWIFNKITFGLSEKSASQKIDDLFEKAQAALQPSSQQKQFDGIIGKYTKMVAERKREDAKILGAIK